MCVSDVPALARFHTTATTYSKSTSVKQARGMRSVLFDALCFRCFPSECFTLQSFPCLLSYSCFGIENNANILKRDNNPFVSPTEKVYKPSRLSALMPQLPHMRVAPTQTHVAMRDGALENSIDIQPLSSP